VTANARDARGRCPRFRDLMRHYKLLVAYTEHGLMFQLGGGMGVLFLLLGEEIPYKRGLYVNLSVCLQL
jgi:hypothetical protein